MQQNNTKRELVVILWDFIPRDTLFYTTRTARANVTPSICELSAKTKSSLLATSFSLSLTADNFLVALISSLCISLEIPFFEF